MGKDTIKRGVGTVAIKAIRAGQTNQEALAAVKKEFPEAKTTLAAINWYRNKLRGEGEKVSKARDLRPKAKTNKKKGDPLD